MEMPKRQSTCLLTDKSKAWKYLAGIKLSSLQPNVVAEDFYEEHEKPVEKNEPDVYSVSKSMVCSLCDCKFEDRHQQKEHYRLDWHRFNLKQRMLGLKSVSEDAFSQQADDVSSISGSGDSSTSSSEDETDMSPISHRSRLAPGRRKKANSLHKYDSDDDDDGDALKECGNGRRCPRIYFENDEGQVVSLYRCIVHGKREAPSSHTELISRTLGLLTNQKWAFMMTGGGHFAAAVYDGPEVIVHKTFHRYTVRAKRGTVQSVRDAQGNTCKSAGAAIRRHNEAALNEDVQNLLASWKEYLDACSRIFLRVHTYNRPMFYSGKNPALVKGDDRVVTVPFATRRATFKEVKRVWELLATIECHGTIKEVKAALDNPKEKREWKKKSPSKDKGKDLFQEDDAPVEVILKRLDEQSLEDGSRKDASTDNSSRVSVKENQTEKESEGDDDVELHEEIVITSTDHLKEYETSHKKQRRRRKKKEQSKTPQEDKTEENLTTELFTICRTGNMDKFEEIMKKIQEHFRTPPQVLSHSQNRTDENLPQGPSELNNRPLNRTSTNQDIDNKDNIPSEEGSTEDRTGSFSQISDVDNPDGGKTGHLCNRNVGESGSKCSESKNNVTEFPNGMAKNEDELVEGRSRSLKNDFTMALEPNQVNVPDEEVPNSDASKVKALECSEDLKKPSPGLVRFLNKPLDDMGYTFLHVATEDGQRRVLYRLMECGADPGIKNKKGKPAYGCSLDKKTREEFKKFRADHPVKYDYFKAQIPEPLTEEQEKERAAKQAERKRNARKAKRVKEKEQKEAREEERRVKEEEMKEKKKKEWFANLSDREKRALAAEKRFAMQTTSTSDMQRCWGCGSSLTAKVPFSYMDFKFCSMPCLKKHKQQQQQS